MDTVALAAGAATLLSTFQLLPQLLRSKRIHSTVGLSVVWASIGGVINTGWIAYRWSQELWLSLPSPIITALLYVVLLGLVAGTARQVRHGLAASTVVVVTLVIAWVLGGWALVGTALGIWGGVQVAPAVWSAFRSRRPLAVAPGLWIVGLGQALLWGYYGYAVGDTAFVIYGVSVGVGSLAVLARLVVTRGRTGQISHSEGRIPIAAADIRQPLILSD